MSLATRIYVTEQGATDHDSTVRLAREIGADLHKLLDDGLLEGFQSVAITSEEHFEQDDLPRELVEGVTEGRLPAVYVNLTYDDENPRQTGADHTDFLFARGLRPAWP
jgi:hypothetical protein